MRFKNYVTEDDDYVKVITRLGTGRERATLDDQIVYATAMLNGRRKGLEHAQSEAVRLQGEVQIFESLLATLRAKKT